jgi:hypothetical protein
MDENIFQHDRPPPFLKNVSAAAAVLPVKGQKRLRALIQVKPPPSREA